MLVINISTIIAVGLCKVDLARLGFLIASSCQPVYVDLTPSRPPISKLNWGYD